MTEDLYSPINRFEQKELNFQFIIMKSYMIPPGLEKYNHCFCWTLLCKTTRWHFNKGTEISPLKTYHRGSHFKSHLWHVG